jgi:hypothetical protein
LAPPAAVPWSGRVNALLSVLLLPPLAMWWLSQQGMLAWQPPGVWPRGRGVLQPRQLYMVLRRWRAMPSVLLQGC